MIFRPSDLAKRCLFLLGGLLVVLTGCTRGGNGGSPIGAGSQINPDGYAGGGVESYLAAAHGRTLRALDLYELGYDLDSLGQSDGCETGQLPEVCATLARISGADSTLPAPTLMSDVLSLLQDTRAKVRARMVQSLQSPKQVYVFSGLPFEDGLMGNIARTPTSGVGPTDYYWPELALLAQKGDDSAGTQLVVHEAEHTLVPSGFDHRLLDREPVLHFTAANGFATDGTWWAFQGAGAVLAKYASEHATYSAAVMADRPLGYWRLDESEPVYAAADRSGHGHPGSYLGAVGRRVAARLPGDSNPGIALSNQLGLDTSAKRMQSAVQIDFTDGFSGGRDLVVELRMNWDGKYDMFTGDAMVFGFPGLGLSIVDGKLGFTTGAGDLWGTAVERLAGRWIHVVAIFHADARASELYLDGVRQSLGQLVGTTPLIGAGFQTSWRSMRWGGWPSDDYHLFSGAIDEPAIYASLGSVQISAHALLAQSDGAGIDAPADRQYACSDTADVFGRALFLDLLGRPAATSELPRSAAASDLVDGVLRSAEWQEKQIAGLYRDVLNRPQRPNATEIASWRAFHSSNPSWEAMLESFLESDEFLVTHGFDGSAGVVSYPVLVNSLYQIAVGRASAVSEIAQWTPVLVQNTTSRNQLIHGLVFSPEASDWRVTKLAGMVGITTLDAARLTQFSQSLQTGTANDEDILRSLLLSADYALIYPARVAKFYACGKL